MDKAKEAILNLDDSQNYVDLMSPDDMVTLPVGVKKEIGNITYILGITSAKFTPQYTEVTAFVKIILPQLDAQGKQKQLFFLADNIKLSHKGGVYGEANLVLLGDAPIPVSGGKSLVVLKEGFGKKRKEKRKKRRKRQEEKKNEHENKNKNKIEIEEKAFSFTYKEHVFEGSHNEVSNQIVELPKSLMFDKVTFKEHADTLELLENNMKANEEVKRGKYKKETVKYLDYLYEHKALKNKFNEITYSSLQQLYTDISKLDFTIENQYLIFLTDKQRRQE